MMNQGINQLSAFGQDQSYFIVLWHKYSDRQLHNYTDRVGGSYSSGLKNPKLVYVIALLVAGEFLKLYKPGRL